MENGQKKSNNHNRFYIAIAVILLLAVIGIYLRGCGGDADIEQLHKSTDRTVGEIEKQYENAGRELDAATGQLDSAGAAVGRADEFVDRSQECVVRNTESVIECQQIVRECREIVADSNRIYREVEKANQNRAGSGG